MKAYFLQPNKVIVDAIGIILIGIVVSFLLYRIFMPPNNIADTEPGRLLAKNGRGSIPTCNNCHGQNGEGDFKNGLPRLAGLDAKYIEKQLEDFARDPLPTRTYLKPITKDYTKTPRTDGNLTVFTPGIRINTVMNKLAKLLSRQDRQNLAIYYSQLRFVAQPIEHDFKALERGQDLALRGKPKDGVPACLSCHGPLGEGFGPLFPPLAGQPASYIKKQITHWQIGKRDNDNQALMRNIANQLTDDDKQHIAAYYSHQSYSVNAD